MADADLAEVIDDPRWLAHRYSSARDELHFVWLTREDHRRAAFLSDLPADPKRPQRMRPAGGAGRRRAAARRRCT